MRQTGPHSPHFTIRPLTHKHYTGILQSQSFSHNRLQAGARRKEEETGGERRRRREGTLTPRRVQRNGHFSTSSLIKRVSGWRGAKRARCLSRILHRSVAERAKCSTMRECFLTTLKKSAGSTHHSHTTTIHTPHTTVSHDMMPFEDAAPTTLHNCNHRASLTTVTAVNILKTFLYR